MLQKADNIPDDLDKKGAPGGTSAGRELDQLNVPEPLTGTRSSTERAADFRSQFADKSIVGPA